MPRSWCIEVSVAGDGWFTNDLRFATEEEAGWYARELVGRWSAIAAVRLSPTEEPPTHLCSPQGSLVKWVHSDGNGDKS